MAPRNPSELARLEDDLQYYTEKSKNLKLSKTTRAVCIKKIREIESTLGIDRAKL